MANMRVEAPAEEEKNEEPIVEAEKDHLEICDPKPEMPAEKAEANEESEQ